MCLPPWRIQYWNKNYISICCWVTGKIWFCFLSLAMYKFTIIQNFYFQNNIASFEQQPSFARASSLLPFTIYYCIVFLIFFNENIHIRSDLGKIFWKCLSIIYLLHTVQNVSCSSFWFSKLNLYAIHPDFKYFKMYLKSIQKIRTQNKPFLHMSAILL